MIKIYCDGGCFPNPGMGAWAFCVDAHDAVAISDKTIFFSGAQPNTTNNAMEITALLESLKWCKDNGKTNVMIYSDSMYVVRLHNEWMHTWKSLGWRRKKGAVQNIDLIKLVYGLSREVKSHCEWVRGHNGNVFNEFVDSLANKAMQALINGRLATYDNCDLGDDVSIQLGDFYAITFKVKAKFHGSATIYLEPVGGKSAKPLLLSSKEFTDGKYVKL